ncbi:Ubiquinone biosynthesis O-methyltransferase, mitochondrial [Paraconexibacter sp. AEG42_29]|uniref:Ubiquinone biosynthesis O-methyltransferase, mitochondrial n=1 Tax=Paraconexibacter sp. AEG42_29 TaxID=2997339 RepID=A0AAU7B262_9ACTN
MTADASVHPEWQRRLEQARDEVIPWIEKAIPLVGRTVLEYGCGQGAVACAIAPRCGRHIGVDIDAGEVALAEGHVARLGLGNVELHAAAVDEILDHVRGFAGEVDVILLYAVLEHLTLDERLAVLRVAREVVRKDGHIVVTETPNRLVPVDQHTSYLPFFHALPLPLAAQYYDRSPRKDFVAAVDTADAAGGGAAVEEALARWGWGMSFHEFELVFEDLPAHTVASSYSPLLYPGRPVRWEELQLAATLDCWRPDLPPCWSRSWIDTILSAEPSPTPRTFVRPWQLQVEHDVPGVAMLPNDLIELRPLARLPVQLPGPTSELQVALTAAAPEGALRVHLPGGDTLSPSAVPSLPGQPASYAAVRLETPVDRVELELDGGGCIAFVGYAGPADPALAQGRPRGW